jgi:hypothetical protein
LQIYGTFGRSLTFFDEDFHNRGVFGLRQAMVSDHVGHNRVWEASNDFRSEDKGIHDYRAGDERFESRPLTTADRSLNMLGEPPFGEFEDLLRRAEQYLENEGFGKFN